MAYANGLIPYSAMTALSTGGYLLAPAAAAFETWRIQAARAGYDLRPTSSSDTFRPYSVQERIFLDRYRPGNLAGRPGFTNDVRPRVGTWRGTKWTRRAGTAAAAVPGTSNHGKALAVDIKNAGPFGGPFHAWMSRTGPALGWSNVEGRSVNEPWHWVHSGASLVDNPITGGGSVTIPDVPGAPAPIEEDEMSQAGEARILEMLEQLLNGTGTHNAQEDGDSILGHVRALRGEVSELPVSVWSAKVGRGENRRTLATVLASVPQDVWAVTVDRGSAGKVNALQELANANTALAEVRAREAAQTELIRQLTTGTATGAPVQVDYDRIDASVRAAVEDGTAEVVAAIEDGVDVNVTVSTPTTEKG